MAKNDGGGFVLGLFIGGVIGAMAGLLLAPKSGSETRAELADMGEAWRARADEIAAEMMSRHAMPDFSNVGERVGPAVDAVREAGTGAVASARERADALRARVGGDNGAASEDASAMPVAADAAESTPPQERAS